MRECTSCAKLKKDTEFVKAQKRGRTYRSHQCKACRTVETGEGRIRRRRVLRKRITEYLVAHPCVDCGEADPLVLEFDHRAQHTKEATIAKLVAQAYTWDRVEEEIAKCDVRCANCHRRRTHKQLGWHARSGK